ncbi:hypothetical protein FCI23_34330 [Actinacidiphila oryziradicis]|uniref:Uncharacterized protein n=1 Tax=Actinacidiphila oryziradicis TaxID=2571141 RepID=A0A4U0SWG4_9ACTN|nr:hypothetical protein FCI23_34330 [Actinacidiphila oryziradicis]
MRESHPLLTFFIDAADSRFPPVDGLVTVLPPLDQPNPGVLSCSFALPSASAGGTLAYPEGPICNRAPERSGHRVRGARSARPV